MQKANDGDRKAVLQTIGTMNTAFARGDIDAVMGTYEPGAVVVGEPGKPVYGDAELRAMFAGFVAANAKFQLGKHEVVQAGDLALHLTDWRTTGTAPDGSAVGGTGLSVAVLRRDCSGAWRLVIDHPFGDELLKRP